MRALRPGEVGCFGLAGRITRASSAPLLPACFAASGSPSSLGYHVVRVDAVLVLREAEAAVALVRAAVQRLS